MRILSLDPAPFHALDYHSSAAPPGQRLRLPFLRGRLDEAPGSFRALIVLSDLQGREDLAGQPGRLLGEAVAEELSLLAELGELPPLGECLALVCGDLYDYPDLRKKGGSGPVDGVWAALAARFGQVLGVLGNHDRLESDLAQLPNARALDGEVLALDGLRITGLDGIIGKPGKPRRRSEADFLAGVAAALRAEVDLLLLHEGPAHPSERGVHGSRAIRETLAAARHGPLVCFGHCHWPEPLAEIGPCQMLNVDARVVALSAALSPA